MHDQPMLPPSHLAPAMRQFRSTSQSPSRPRLTDDLISQLSPRGVVDALRNPSGALKVCMDAAGPIERSFAMRTALASMKIHGWLQELLQWQWPADNTSAGFDPMSSEKRREGGNNAAPGAEKGGGFVRSLTEAQLTLYETRIDEIHADMDDMDVEGIKAQVLHSHILPLSRPGTPMSESGRSIASTMSSYTKMDDLTALITATIVQALPSLSRLTRLMSVWSARLLVFRKSAVFLTAIADAEVALESGWRTVDLSKSQSPADNVSDSKDRSTLSRNDFDVMRQVVGRKVAKCGREVDTMLDALEGVEDTIPDEWIDRLESLEVAYGDWVAACERIIREAEWTRRNRETAVVALVPPSSPEGTMASGDDATICASEKVANPPPAALHPDAAGLGHLDIAHNTVEPHEVAQNVVEERPSSPLAVSIQIPDMVDTVAMARETSLDKPEQDAPTPTKPTFPPQDAIVDLDGVRDIHEADTVTPKSSTRNLHGSANTIPSFDGLGADNAGRAEGENGLDLRHVKLGARSLDSADKRYGFVGEDFADHGIFDFDAAETPDAEVEEPELPPLVPTTASQGDVPGASDIPRLIQRDVEGFSSDLLFGTPDPLRSHPVFVDPRRRDDGSPSSSPPDFGLSTRSTSMGYGDMPPLAEVPDADTPPKTPLDNPRLEDVDSPITMDSPGRGSEVSTDDQLQQQISEILETIPAKIRLTSEPTAINLNPPDLALPRIRTRPDPMFRSHSSLSSRAGTPSFTLAPAFSRGPRPRTQRGNQEIKVYHLSRSTGEPPIKLLIRLVGDTGERVMVRVGGGWADLGEYLKEYAAHHSRRSGGESKVEIKDVLRGSGLHTGSSPPSRPASALDSYSPVTPLTVRKTRKSAAGAGEDDSNKQQQQQPKTPLAATTTKSSDTPSSEISTRSRSSSRLSWTEEDSSLGMAGPRARNVEISEESKAWVESVKEKVRLASGERKVSDSLAEGKFGDMGKVGGTKRLFRKRG